MKKKEEHVASKVLGRTLIVLAVVSLLVFFDNAPKFFYSGYIVSAPTPTGMQQLEKGSFVSKVDGQTYPYIFGRNGNRLCSGPRNLQFSGEDPNLGYHNWLILGIPGDNFTTIRPLYVYMHGGGMSSWITNANGTKSLDPPERKIMVHEETKQELVARVSNYYYPDPAWLGNLAWPPIITNSLNRKVANSLQYRTLIVSYCDNDMYSGISTTADPDNPNKGPNGELPKVDGLLALVEAINYTKTIVPTSKDFVEGCSAGGAGVQNLAHYIESTGGKINAIISESASDHEHLNDVIDMGTGNPGSIGNWRNWRPKIGYYTTYGDINNPTYPNLGYKAILDGRIKNTPIYAVWSPNDTACGGPGSCSQMFLPLKDAVALGNPGGYPVGDARRSRVREVCTNSNCDQHCPLTGGVSSTSPDSTLVNDVFTWMEKIRTDSPTPTLTTSITSPLSGSIVKGTTIVSVNATDNIAVTSVELYRNSTLIGTDSSSPYSFVWNTSLSASGQYDLQSKAYDVANNVGISPIVTVMVDNVPPIVSITDPSTTTAAIRSTLTIIASATDNVAISKVEFYVNNALQCADTTLPYSCVWKVPATRNKKYNIVAKAYDTVGNTAMSSPITITSS